ncbi:MAG: hypothetical protein ACKOZT_08435 [Cyanobium sp.]
MEHGACDPNSPGSPGGPAKKASAWSLLRLLAALLAMLLAALPGWIAPDAAQAAGSGGQLSRYRCDGEPLLAELIRGAVDEPAIPDPSHAPVPVGGVVLLHWRQLDLQLPRTNNAGPASFTDGRWWWSLEDPAHPRLRLRNGGGGVQDFVCEAA